MELKNLINPPALHEVFIPGGQPSITYVDRAHLSLERSLQKALAQGNLIVSLTGATKSGKTVLCRSVLDDFEYVWIDGGQVKAEADLWSKVATELGQAAETKASERDDSGSNVGGSVGMDAVPLGTGARFQLTVGGSRLKARTVENVQRPNTMHAALEALLEESVFLVIDDFHHIPEAARSDIVRSIKGAVFRGLKVVLLSTPHRAFDAVKAEVEITGRFKHVPVPDWGIADLQLIATTGFDALNVKCPKAVVEDFAKESQGSPLLMQQFCWNICYDNGIQKASVKEIPIPSNFNVKAIYAEVAKDAGLPTYEKLAKGPQTRTPRIMRPLKNGNEVDIYQAILYAVAATGPTEKISYNEIRNSLNNILADKIPQKLEVSNALKHLAAEDEKENKGQRAVDWDEDALELVITDPFFRFYLRWEIAPRSR